MLATLGYGDAIGHEVLGIQKVLRAAGYRSDIFVETADSRLEDLTRDYRDLIDEATPETVLIHHFSIGSRASRVAYALPGRMISSTTTSRRRCTSPACTRCSWSCASSAAASSVPTRSRCALALGDSEFNRQELVELGFPRTDVLPVVPSFVHLDVAPDRTLAQAFDDELDQPAVRRPGHPEQEDRERHPALPRLQERHNPRSRLLLVGSSGGFERYFAMLQKLIADLGAHDVHFLGHVSDAELAAYYEVADLFLCASEHEGFCVPLMEAFHIGVPVVAYAATAIPATMDGGGVLYTDTDPAHVAAIVDAVVSDPDSRGADRRGAGRGAGAAAGPRLRRPGARLRRAGAGDAAAAGAARRLRLLGSLRATQQLEELHQYRPGAYGALPSPVDSARGQTAPAAP